MSEIKYALNFGINTLDILFYTESGEELEYYEYSNSLKTYNFNQSIFVAIDEALKIYCETEGKQDTEFEFNEITITFGTFGIDPNITLCFVTSLISKFKIIKIINIIIKNSPFINYKFDLPFINFLLDIEIINSANINVYTFKGIVKSLGVILSNVYSSSATYTTNNDDVANEKEENTNILALNFKELIFRKDANALRIDYKKSLFSNKKILSILTDEINYNISKYTLSKITRGYMNFYYHNSTKKLFLQYHESRGMTISCIYYNKNNVQVIKNEYPKIVKITNDSKIKDNTFGGITNPSINYTISKFGEQIINFTDRNVILSVSFMNSYFYGANCEIKEDGNKLIYTCNVCDYTKINNNSEDKAMYKYYNVDVYSKKQQIKKSDYLYLGEWDLVKDEYIADIIINKNLNDKMTISRNETFTYGDNTDIKKEFDNIHYNTYTNENLTIDVKAMYDNYENGDATTSNFAPPILVPEVPEILPLDKVPEVSNDNNKYICSSVVGISYDNDKLIFINDYIEVDVATVESCVFFKAEETIGDVLSDDNLDHSIGKAVKVATKSSNTLIIVDEAVKTDVYIAEYGLSEYNNKIVGKGDTHQISKSVQEFYLKSEIPSNDLPKNKPYKVNVTSRVSKTGIKVKISTEKTEDSTIMIKSEDNINFKGNSSLITNKNPNQTLIFAGTKIEEDIKTTTYGTLNVFLNTIEPSKIKLIEKEEKEDDKYKSPITFENIRITTPEDQCLEVVLPNTVIEKPEIKQIELFDGKIKFSGSTVSQLSVNSIVLYKDVNPSDVIFGINLKNIKIIKVDNTKKQKLIKRYQTLILMSTLVNKNTDEYKLMLLEILKLKKEIANTV